MHSGRGWGGVLACTATLACLLGLLPSVAMAARGKANASPNPPSISGTPATSVTVGALYQFQPLASDPDGDSLTFSISNRPRWLSFDNRSGRLSGSPGAGDRGVTRAITITVSDGTSKVSLPAFAIVVGSDGMPLISGSPVTSVTEGDLYAFVPQASDPEGATLTFSIANKPSWATFTRSSGLLSGIPPAGAAGTYSNIVISVSDGQTLTSLPAFSVTVKAMGNQAPVIYGVPASSVEAGSAYSFQPNASDPEGSPLKFSVANLPGWATFDTATGRLSGSAQAGTYSGITISTSDGQLTASLAPFSISVTAVNRTPTIVGAPAATATAGQPYSFVPMASDPDGQKLSFSISGKPSWANFDSATGALTGTPSDTQVATYSNIVISVTDGQASASLSPFSITVDKAAAGWASLSWVPPTENVDGTPITNLAGYRIRYGQSAGSLTQTLTIPNPAVTGATIEALKTGTWYFAVSAYTAANVESELSNLAQKTVL